MADLLRPTRRGLIGGLGLLFAAPAIVKASSLMPVKVYRPDFELVFQMWPGGVNWMRGGAVMPDGTIRTGPEFKGNYTEWRTPAPMEFRIPVLPAKRIRLA